MEAVEAATRKAFTAVLEDENRPIIPQIDGRPGIASGRYGEADVGRAGG